MVEDRALDNLYLCRTYKIMSLKLIMLLISMATLNGIINTTVFTATQPIKTKTLYAIDFYSVHQTVVPYKILRS